MQTQEFRRKCTVFKDKTLLITGGTGSFGNAILGRFLDSDIGEIRIFSRDEKKQDDMRKDLKNRKVRFYIGDVRNIESVNEAMRGVDFVFHAAALKQVPSCEFFPMEAVRTNVLGTDNVLTAAINQRIKKVICLSTDKAAYPINAMGTSKAMMEKIVVAKSRNVDPSETMICCTRYGNVMASRGSVIPLFANQAMLDLPITITDPGMTRFMMTLNDAVDLVVTAFQQADQGDLLVQKAPAATIEDLAKAIILFYSSNSTTEVIGTRHGEKRHETLLTIEEMKRSTDIGEYYKVPADTRDLNYESYISSGEHDDRHLTDYTSENTRQLSIDEILTKLESIQDLIPFRQ
jgi:UDP-N-acetylglucosamine 4,6-dehydratase/5-epimerase